MLAPYAIADTAMEAMLYTSTALIFVALAWRTDTGRYVPPYGRCTGRVSMLFVVAMWVCGLRLLVTVLSRWRSNRQRRRSGLPPKKHPPVIPVQRINARRSAKAAPVRKRR